MVAVLPAPAVPPAGRPPPAAVPVILAAVFASTSTLPAENACCCYYNYLSVLPAGTLDHVLHVVLPAAADQLPMHPAAALPNSLLGKQEQTDNAAAVAVGLFK